MVFIRTHWPIFVILIIGSSLRFYNLGLIPGPVFDEVFYPTFGLNYILEKSFFSVHPPAGTYLISLSIYIYHFLPWTETVLASVTSISDLNPISYRWLSALAGTSIIYVAYRICFELFNKRNLALLAALFFAIDGSLLVDSRFGLINVYLSLFGLLSALFLIKFLKVAENLSSLFISCFFLGLTFAIKWLRILVNEPFIYSFGATF